MNDLNCQWKVVASHPTGVVMEISFQGVHHWTHGAQMSAFISQAFEGQTRVIGVIIDLLAYDYEFGNDVAGLFEAFIDRERHVPRPACVVATGGTYASLHPFFLQAKLLETFRLRFVSSSDEGMEWLRNELSCGAA